jgi:hypothetical protein
MEALQEGARLVAEFFLNYLVDSFNNGSPLQNNCLVDFFNNGSPLQNRLSFFREFEKSRHILSTTMAFLERFCVKVRNELVGMCISKGRFMGALLDEFVFSKLLDEFVFSKEVAENAVSKTASIGVANFIDSISHEVNTMNLIDEITRTFAREKAPLLPRVASLDPLSPEEINEMMAPFHAFGKKEILSEDNGKNLNQVLRLFRLLRQEAALAIQLIGNCSSGFAYCSNMNVTSDWVFLCASHSKPSDCSALSYIIHTISTCISLMLNGISFVAPFETNDTTGMKMAVNAFTSIIRRNLRIYLHAAYHHGEIFNRFERVVHGFRDFMRFALDRNMDMKEFKEILSCSDGKFPSEIMSINRVFSEAQKYTPPSSAIDSDTLNRIISDTSSSGEGSSSEEEEIVDKGEKDEGPSKIIDKGEFPSSSNTISSSSVSGVFPSSSSTISSSSVSGVFPSSSSTISSSSVSGVFPSSSNTISSSSVSKESPRSSKAFPSENSEILSSSVGSSNESSYYAKMPVKALINELYFFVYKNLQKGNFALAKVFARFMVHTLRTTDSKD